MRIDSVCAPKISFKRNLLPSEIADYTSTLEQAKDIVGQRGKSIFIMPTSCLPQTNEFNSGIGHLSSDIAQDYLKYMKTYLGFNVVEDIPAGQIPHNRKYYCAYKGSSLALGNQQINPELLATDEFENLLSSDDVKAIANANTTSYKNEISNFNNVMHAKGKQNQILKKAYENFKALPDGTCLKRNYNAYVKEHAFWLDFPRYDEPDQEFFKFKQFIADEHLKIGKEKLHEKGIKLCGDCLINFSKDEQKAFPNAFIKNAYVGADDWKAPALNYDEIFNPNSDAYKLFKTKVQLMAKRYDMIRFDAAWLYVTPTIKSTVDKTETVKPLESKLLCQIENWVREVKGNDFDLKNLIYEFAADSKDFKAFSNCRLIPPLQNRVKVYSSQYMHLSDYDGWGFKRAYTQRGWSNDEFVLGVGNHDNQPLRQMANGVMDEVTKGQFKEYKTDAINALSRELNIPPEKLQDPVEFAKAKWAEPMQAKNNMMFYWDVLAGEESFDGHWQKDFKKNAYKNYALKVPTDYKTAYQKAVQSGYGFNPMDALEKLFIKHEYNLAYPDIFRKIQKFKDILNNPNEISALPPPPKGSKRFLPLVFAGLGIAALVGAYQYFNGADEKKDTDQVAAKQLGS